MVQTDVTERKSKKKFIIIAILVLVLVLSAVATYFLVSNNLVAVVVESLKTNSEYTFPLDEFLINLKTKPNSITKNYVRLKISLMYAEEKQGDIIESSVSKIRDTIISQIRTKTYEEILDPEKTPPLKNEIKDQINTILGQELIKEVYITDIVIQ